MSTFDFDNLLDDPLNDDNDLPLFAEDENEEVVNGQLADGEPVTDAIKVEPKKRTVRNPRPRLTVDILRGPRGIHVIEEYFKNMKFKGKGHESEDLDEVLRRMQHWAHRMYPNYKFDDVLNTIERLSRKKPLQVHMSRYRLGLLEEMVKEDQLLDNDKDDDNAVDNLNEPFDEFDALLDQQIAMSRLDPRTPAPKSRGEPITPASRANLDAMTPVSNVSGISFAIDRQAQSTPNTTIGMNSTKQKFNEEQLARIEENRRLARERLLAKRNQQQQ